MSVTSLLNKKEQLSSVSDKTEIVCTTDSFNWVTDVKSGTVLETAVCLT